MSELLTKSATGKYEQLVLKEKGHWQVGHFIELLGRCGFCGHRSLSGYQIHSDDGRVMDVGTDCVFVLCNLDKKQKEFIKYSARRFAMRRRYGKVLDFLLNKYQGVIFPFATKIREEGDMVIYHDNFRNIDWQCFKERWQGISDGYSTHAPEWSEAWIAWNIVDNITHTTGMSKFWFDKYKQLSGIDLKGVQ